jgi:hypothetical protein
VETKLNKSPIIVSKFASGVDERSIQELLAPAMQVIEWQGILQRTEIYATDTAVLFIEIEGQVGEVIVQKHEQRLYLTGEQNRVDITEGFFAYDNEHLSTEKWPEKKINTIQFGTASRMPRSTYLKWRAGSFSQPRLFSQLITDLVEIWSNQK